MFSEVHSDAYEEQILSIFFNLSNVKYNVKYNVPVFISDGIPCRCDTVSFIVVGLVGALQITIMGHVPATLGQH